MKTITTNYKLSTNGKKLRVELMALFRAVGIGGDVTAAEVPGSVMDTLRVQLVRPNVTGAETLTNDQSAKCHYSLDGSNLDVTLAGLAGGVHRLTVLVGYGTNNHALLIADLLAPDNVLYLVSDAVKMPLERYPEKDVEADGVAYYAYQYAHGDQLAWLMTDKPEAIRGTVEAYYVADISASLDDAEELEGARLVMNYGLDVYDVQEGVALSPVDTFGSASGGGGGSVEKATVLLTVPEGADPVDWTQYHVGVEYLSQGTSEQITLNAQGKCEFEVPAGEQYLVTLPYVPGYSTPIAEHFTAVGGNKTIHYAYHVSANIETITIICRNDSGDLSPIIGQQVTLTTESGYSTSAVIGSDYKAQLTVEYGEEYTIVMPSTDGWHPHGGNISGTADRSERFYIVHYVAASAGAYGVDENGVYYDEASILALEDKTIIKYIAYNDSELEAADRGDGTHGCGFMFKLPASGTNKQWATANQQFDTAILPNLSAAQAKVDFKGYHNTLAMRDLALDMGISSPFAEYLLGLSEMIGGKTFNGFGGAAGQWQKIFDNWTVVNAISVAAGRGTLPFKSWNVWTASQYNSTIAWYFGGGSLYTTGTKTNNLSAVAFFDLYV